MLRRSKKYGIIPKLDEVRTKPLPKRPKQIAPAPTKDYAYNLIIGQCSNCRMIGQLFFPQGTFNYNTADRLMSFEKLIKTDCSFCKRKNVDFIPIDIETMKKKYPGLGILHNSYMGMREELPDGK